MVTTCVSPASSLALNPECSPVSYPACSPLPAASFDRRLVPPSRLASPPDSLNSTSPRIRYSPRSYCAWGHVGRIQKQGFPLKQGVLVPHRVRLLLAKGHSCYRPRRTGERKRKSVRGCIVGSDVRALHLVVVKQGENDIPGLTDEVLPKRLGPKRATKIRRFFNLDKSDDVRKFVIRREVVPKKEGAKPYTKVRSVSFVLRGACC